MKSVVAPDWVWHEDLVANWERGPVLLQARKALMSDDEVFEYLCWLGSEWCARRPGPSRVHFSTERGEVEVHAGVFPMHTDRTFEGYYDRVASEHKTGSTLLYVRNLSKQPAGGLAGEIDGVLLPLWAAGLRWRRLEVELFVGRYDWTSIGVHRELCGNIHQVVEGTKEMIVWPPEALSAREDLPRRAVNGSTFDDASRAGLLEPERCTRIRAGENEAIYFPSGHWHVGVSECLSVSVDLSLYGCDIDFPVM